MLADLANTIQKSALSSPRETADRVRFRLYGLLREVRLGVKTIGDDAENGSATEYQPYVAAAYPILDRAFAGLGCAPGDVCLDYGCGKGRVVAVAATRPFARVIGIELRPELAAISEANLRRLRGRRCGAAEIVHGDATTFAVPDDVTVIVMFNPFTRGVLRATLDRIRESHERRPRPIRIAYMNPREDEDLLASCDWLRRSRDLCPDRWRNMRFGIYESAVRESSVGTGPA